MKLVLQAAREPPSFSLGSGKGGNASLLSSSTPVLRHSIPCRAGAWGRLRALAPAWPWDAGFPHSQHRVASVMLDGQQEQRHLAVGPCFAGFPLFGEYFCSLH